MIRPPRARHELHDVLDLVEALLRVEAARDRRHLRDLTADLAALRHINRIEVRRP